MGIPTSKISADWAAQRIKGLSIRTIISSFLKKDKKGKIIKTLIDSFHYPRLGPGQMWEVCADKAITNGARVQMNATVCGLHYDTDNQTWSVALSDGTIHKGFDHIISSAPIYDLIPGITPSVNARTLQAAKGLGYRDFITVVLILKETTAFTENWIYIHEPSVKVGRIQNFKLWSREMVPDPAMNCYAAFLAGLFAIVLVMIRPNTVVFFILFLFLISTYTRKYLLVLLIPVVMLPACYFSFKNNRNYLSSYTYAVQESIKGLQFFFYPKKPHPPIKMVYLPEWEGWNRAAIDSLSRILKPYNYSDHGNVFVVYKAITKRHMPVSIMNLLSAMFILGFAGICYRLRKTKQHIELPNIAIFGFCLYMISDLFSPVWRHQYYNTQWLFPLLLAATVYHKANKRVYALLLAGLVLNIVNSSYLKMEHTIGEYLMLFTLIYLSLMKPLAEEIYSSRRPFIVPSSGTDNG